MQTDVTRDTKIPEMLQHYAMIKGESCYVCSVCGVQYVTHQHYRNPEKCIDCSDSRHSYDRQKRIVMQRGYHAKRKMEGK